MDESIYIGEQACDFCKRPLATNGSAEWCINIRCANCGEIRATKASPDHDG